TQPRHLLLEVVNPLFQRLNHIPDDRLQMLVVRRPLSDRSLNNRLMRLRPMLTNRGANVEPRRHPTTGSKDRQNPERDSPTIHHTPPPPRVVEARICSYARTVALNWSNRRANCH